MAVSRPSDIGDANENGRSRNVNISTFIINRRLNS